MNPVHCAGCRRRIGYTHSQTTHRVWCSQVCTYLMSAHGNEDRDDVVFLLYMLGKAPSDLAKMLGVSVGRIHQIKNRSTP